MHLRYRYNKRLALSLRRRRLLGERKKNSCKNAREARENSGEANHAQQTNRQLRRLLGLSPSLTVYQ